jgi:GGDEF domain-containing protein
MSLQGPIVVVGDHMSPDLVSALGEAGAFPVVETPWVNAAAAITKIEPAAVILTDLVRVADNAAALALADAIDATDGPFMPVVACSEPGADLIVSRALPIAANAPPSRIITRLASALRIRTLDATAFRRAEAFATEIQDMPQLPDTDPLEDATVLVLGRGRTYPELAVAVGERVGLIGALSIETAARYLRARDVDGIVIGDGFGPRIIETFLSIVADDARFRDLPIGVLSGVALSVEHAQLPNLERIKGSPAEIVDTILPLVRLHAFGARLQRLLAAIEAKGILDPMTGLFTIAAFLRDLQRAVEEAKESGGTLSLARFSFPQDVDRRINADAARLVSRLVRSADFACHANDGSILVTFSGTELRNAHVVARRIGSVLKHTMVMSEADPGTGQSHVNPSITLACLKSNDTVESLLARVSEPMASAAE